MDLLLYINGKKARFWINAGWFRGDDFCLLAIKFFERFSDNDGWTIFSIQITHLIFSFGSEELEL